MYANQYANSQKISGVASMEQMEQGLFPPQNAKGYLCDLQRSKIFRGKVGVWRNKRTINFSPCFAAEYLYPPPTFQFAVLPLFAITI